jgi:hypothetical protein
VHRDNSNGSDPSETVLQIALAYCLSRCLHVIADLGVADHLDERPRAAVELAAAVGANSDALRRTMRLLSAHGVFEVQGETVRHSPASRLLRTDDPRSLRDFVRMAGAPVTWTIYQELGESIRTGRPASSRILPEGRFSYYARHPDEAAIFDAAMTAKARDHVAAIVAAYDFSGFGIIGDVGGGRGHLLRAVLDAAPSARGVLFDLPRVIDAAADVASERLALRAGDFFRDALPICDAYLLMEVIHDWADEDAVAILRAVRRAAPAHARLLLIEQMVPDDPGPAHAKLLDVHMLALLGGRQRTRAEYAALLDASGFSLRREISTRAGISILEATVVAGEWLD